mmetsp:Transcript_682/g.1218  ORF Transcript_682/g.1218 Transcript_682/m.1218 type:complete len:204 (+) Transcript_682:777-1388(+)
MEVQLQKAPPPPSTAVVAGEGIERDPEAVVDHVIEGALGAADKVDGVIIAAMKAVIVMILSQNHQLDPAAVAEEVATARDRRHLPRVDEAHLQRKGKKKLRKKLPFQTKNGRNRISRMLKISRMLCRASKSCLMRKKAQCRYHNPMLPVALLPRAIPPMVELCCLEKVKQLHNMCNRTCEFPEEEKLDTQEMILNSLKIRGMS